jgi:RNA 3'-terminal phosphate cyclase (ATP)
MLTDTPFEIVNIRANRRKPGLLRQHLTCVRAAMEISGAEVHGAELASREVVFKPSGVYPGDYCFSVGTAGSTMLVLQAILPPLMLADGPSRITIEGGTHNMKAPPFDFIAHTFLPIIQQMGPTVTLSLERPGFYPAGGGKVVVTIQPVETLRRIDLIDRGRVGTRRAIASVAKLPRHIADRELNVIKRKLSIEDLEIRELEPSLSPGNVVSIFLGDDRVTEVFTGFGEIGVKAERVADRAVREARRWMTAEVPVGEHLADQLLIPMALAGGGSYRTLPLSLHTTTNIETIRRFLDLPIAVDAGDTATVTLG